jgi:hypothetical protein
MGEDHCSRMSVSDVEPKKARKLTTLAKEIQIAFIRFLARFLACFFEFAGLIPCNSMDDV